MLVGWRVASWLMKSEPALNMICQKKDFNPGLKKGGQCNPYNMELQYSSLELQGAHFSASL